MTSPKKIMVISNDLTLYRRLQDLLNGEGYNTSYTQSTDSRLKAHLEEIDPDLIVIDPDTPSFKGIELSLLVRQWSPAPILMLTTFASNGHEVRALDMESGDYLSEPLDIGLVAARIDLLLSASRA
jgi:DNA-binding response OmpR family regulator